MTCDTSSPRRNITKEVVQELEAAPVPEEGTILEIREGKVQKLGDIKSGIFKKKLNGRQYVTTTGLAGDEHTYYVHGGIDRALHQYCPSHYEDWRGEKSGHSDLFDRGAFGENLVGTSLNEDNVCIGDLFRIGEEIIVQVSEPRSPCYKLNIRFQWRSALKRATRTGRVGWNFRVLQPGYIQPGDKMVLIERPHPQWSITNVKRTIQGKTVALPLLCELAQLEVMTEMIRDAAQQRLEKTSKTYELVEAEMVTSRVKKLTFDLREPIDIQKPAFKTFSFSQIEFGEDIKYARSYSIVSGDMNKFSLGVALDDHSRGGSAYIHKSLKVGDRIKMAPNAVPQDIEDEERSVKDDNINRRIIIIGGIGVTAFLPTIEQWEASNTAYEVHYAVRDADDAAFLHDLPKDKTTVYAKTRKERLDIHKLIPTPDCYGTHHARIYSCGPSGMMDACKKRAEELNYPEHLLHFESFGADAGGPRGAPFKAEVLEVDSGRGAKLDVPADKSLLQVLREAGFDMTYFCEAGACGACKVSYEGEVKHNGSCLQKSEAGTELLSCVDRGIGTIKIELD